MSSTFSLLLNYLNLTFLPFEYINKLKVNQNVQQDTAYFKFFSNFLTQNSYSTLLFHSSALLLPIKGIVLFRTNLKHSSGSDQ